MESYTASLQKMGKSIGDYNDIKELKSCQANVFFDNKGSLWSPWLWKANCVVDSIDSSLTIYNQVRNVLFNIQEKLDINLSWLRSLTYFQLQVEGRQRELFINSECW